MAGRSILRARSVRRILLSAPGAPRGQDCPRHDCAALAAVHRSGYLPHMSNEPAQAAAARLCADCGLCCNGVIFDRVILQREDRATALAALGLRIKRRSFFNQPCSALCGTRCTIYADRPVRCRLFECRQYRDVAAGTITADAAVARIAEAKRQVVVVEALLDALGGDNRRKPIAQRCATVFAEAPSPDSAVAARRAELSSEMEKLQTLLTTHFRLM